MKNKNLLSKLTGGLVSGLALVVGTSCSEKPEPAKPVPTIQAEQVDRAPRFSGLTERYGGEWFFKFDDEKPADLAAFINYDTSETKEIKATQQIYRDDGISFKIPKELLSRDGEIEVYAINNESKSSVATRLIISGGNVSPRTDSNAQQEENGAPRFDGLTRRYGDEWFFKFIDDKTEMLGAFIRYQERGKKKIRATQNIYRDEGISFKIPEEALSRDGEIKVYAIDNRGNGNKSEVTTLKVSKGKVYKHD